MDKSDTRSASQDKAKKAGPVLCLCLGCVDELKTYFVDQTAKNGGNGPAERMAYTFKGIFPSDCRRVVHPNGPGLHRPTSRQFWLDDAPHRLRQLYLVLNDAFPGEMHLQFVHTA